MVLEFKKEIMLMKVFQILVISFALLIGSSVAEQVKELSMEQKIRLVRLIDNTHQPREVLLPLLQKGDVTDYQIACADSIARMSGRVNDYTNDESPNDDDMNNVKSNAPRMRDRDSVNKDSQLSFSDSLELVKEFKFLSDDRECLWLEDKLEFVYAVYPVEKPTVKQYLSKIEEIGLDIINDAMELYRVAPLEIIKWMLSLDYNIPDYLMVEVLDIDSLSEKQAMELAKVYDFTDIGSCMCSDEDGSNRSSISQRGNSHDHVAAFEPGDPLYTLHTLFSTFISDGKSKGGEVKKKGRNEI